MQFDEGRTMSLLVAYGPREARLREPRLRD